MCEVDARGVVVNVRAGTVVRYILIQKMLTEVRLAAFYRMKKAHEPIRLGWTSERFRPPRRIPTLANSMTLG